MSYKNVSPLPPRCAKALKAAQFCAVVIIVGLAGALAQQAPNPDVSKQAPKTSVAAQPKPSAEELERWRQGIVHTKRPKKACFTAQYPATTWTEVPCGKPPKGPFLPAKRGTPPRSRIVGGFYDVMAQPNSGTGFISQAEGSFDSVTVKGECSVACNQQCLTNQVCSSSDLKNDFSLQLNTNQFSPTSACENHKGCQGWQQFVFSNRACPDSALPACAFIEYWLIGYGPNCPSGWSSELGTDCVINSQNSVNFLPYVIDDLGFMKLRGEVVGANSQDDEVTFTVSDKAYSAPGDNRLPDLGINWQWAEFNVLGSGNGNQAVFNPGTSLVVRIVVDGGTVGPPLCTIFSTTAETNNLTLTQLQTNPTNAPVNESKRTDISTTQSGAVVGGPWSGGPGPAVVFGESNAPDAIPLTMGCDGTVAVGGPPIPPPGTGTGGVGPIEHGCKNGERSCDGKCMPMSES
jgi:hypothetical protein